MTSIMNGPLSELCSPIYSTPTNSWQAWDSNGKILTEHQMVNKSNCVNKLKMFISNFIGDPNKIHSNQMEEPCQEGDKYAFVIQMLAIQVVV